MNDETRGWLAGILEGEGCFTAQKPAKSRPTHSTRPKIEVHMTDEDVIQRVAGIFGTCVNRRERPNPAWRTLYRTQVTGKKAIAIMREVYPLMGERRRAKIDTLLEELA